MGWSTQAAPQGLQGPGVPIWQGRCWAWQGTLGPGAYKGLPRAGETSVVMRQGPGEEMQLCPGRGPTADPLQRPCHEKVRPTGAAMALVKEP